MKDDYDVNFRENFHFANTIESFFDERQKIFVFDRYEIKLTIIDAKSKIIV